MSTRETVPPATLRVERIDGGIAVYYLDGRRTVYDLEPTRERPPLSTHPGLLVQVLLVEEGFDQGMLIYVNDRDTSSEILEDSGVGRINLHPDEAAVLLPGIEVEMDGHRATIDVDFDVVDGRVFVFEEGQLGAAAYELIDGGGG